MANIETFKEYRRTRGLDRAKEYWRSRGGKELRALAEARAARAHLQEAISEPIIEPSSVVGEAARERKTLWAIATPNSLTIKVVYQPL